MAWLCCGGDPKDDEAQQAQRRQQHKQQPPAGPNSQVQLNTLPAGSAPASLPVDKQPGAVPEPHLTVSKSAASLQGVQGIPAALEPAATTATSKSSASGGSAAGAPALDGAPAGPPHPDDIITHQTAPVAEAPIPLKELSETAQDLAPLLGPMLPEFKDRKCLVLDLDETLVHSSFRYIHEADFVIPVEIDGQYHSVYVIKRPGVDEFMQRVGQLFEVVIFTASVAKYGDPLLTQLDIHHVVHHRLFRDACMNFGGNYVKDLSRLGRPLDDVIIIDNSPTSYLMHQQHAIPISSWFSDAHDNELLDMIPFLEQLSSIKVPNVTLILDTQIDDEVEAVPTPAETAEAAPTPAETVEAAA